MDKWMNEFINVSCPFQKHNYIFLSGMTEEKTYWRDLESKSVNDKAGASEDSVMSQKLNILGFTGLMI